MSDRPKTFMNSKKFRRKEKETLPGGKKRSRAPGFWSRPETKRLYILLGLCVTISVLLYPNILVQPKIYKLGDVADRDIKASSEFLIANNKLTEQHRIEAVKAVPPVYDFDPSANNLTSRIKEAFEVGRVYVAESLSATDSAEGAPAKTPKTKEHPPIGLDAFKARFFEILEVPADDKVFDVLLRSDFPPEIEKETINLVAQVIVNGVVGNKKMLMSHSGKKIILHNIYSEKEIELTDLSRFHDLKAATDLIKKQKKNISRSIISKELANVTLKLASNLIKPNLTFNKRETEIRKNLARESVKPFFFQIKKGEMLVREGERIAPEHLLKLSEQNRFLKREDMLSRAPAMAVLIGFLISSMYLVGLMTYTSRRGETRDLLFNAVNLFIIFLMVMAASFVSEETARGFHFFSPRAIVFAIPVASGAMLVSIFQGMGVAASFSLILSVLAVLVVGEQVEFFIFFFISSLVGAYGVRHCRERGIFIKTGLKVGLANIIIALSIETLHASLYTMEALIAFASAFIGGILAGIIAAGFLPLIEMSFGYTTDIKLLELASLDQPLLRDLMVQAPGSHHHSVIVSNLVEASAQAINANPLLSKVAAYYHDIGKIKKPLYFVENQGDRENKHEKLAPSMSSLILISHVKDGVELAKKHKLGREIIDIISQHHGTSLISFFYEKAREQEEKKGGRGPRVKEENFRYPGPKPQTKEAGLVMLADVVEAASRTLVDPTAARIQGMVQKIINKVFSDGQLDECELTLKDLHEIAKSFYKTLSGIHHHRLEYPEPVSKDGSVRHRDRLVEAGRSVKKVSNGNTDQLPAGTSQAENPKDETKNGESLKRLGL